MEDWAHLPAGLHTFSCYLRLFSLHFPHLKSALFFPLWHHGSSWLEAPFPFPSPEGGGRSWFSSMSHFFHLDDGISWTENKHSLIDSLHLLPLFQVLQGHMGLWKLSRSLSFHLSNHFRPCSLLQAHWPPTPCQKQPHFTQGLLTYSVFPKHSLFLPLVF